MALLKPSRLIRRLVHAWPGKKTFGMYRFLPLFFCMGAVLEYSMINWYSGPRGDINFYNTYKKRRAQELAAQSLYLDKVDQENPGGLNVETVTVQNQNKDS